MSILNINKVLREKNISNTKLAAMMNVTPQYISEVVNGKRNITLNKLAKFAEVLEVPFAALFDGYVKPTDENCLVCPSCGNIVRLERCD